MPPEQTLTELVAEARYANDRVALTASACTSEKATRAELAELERTAAGAQERLEFHRAAAEDTGGDGRPRSGPPSGMSMNASTQAGPGCRLIALRPLPMGHDEIDAVAGSVREDEPLE